MTCLNRSIGKMQSRSVFPPRDGSTGHRDIFAQIIEPHDRGISESITANLTPVTWETDVFTSSLCLDVTREMHDAYFASLSNLIVNR